jgi:hypothetical protein
MASALYAVTEIRHGDKDGNVKVFQPDEQVTGLSQEVVKTLVDSGAVSPKKVAPEMESLQEDLVEARNRIAELERELGTSAAVTHNTGTASLIPEDEQLANQTQEPAEPDDEDEPPSPPAPPPGGQQ